MPQPKTWHALMRSSWANKPGCTLRVGGNGAYDCKGHPRLNIHLKAHFKASAPPGGIRILCDTQPTLINGQSAIARRDEFLRPPCPRDFQ